MSKGTLRRHFRLDVRAPIQIIWKDRNGEDKFTNAHTIDVSESGLRAEVPEPVPERSYVTFRADSLALSGTASVRSCHLKGVKYVLGLEFSTGLKWRPKSDLLELAQALEPEEHDPVPHP